jgi:hypothetical protein
VPRRVLAGLAFALGILDGINASQPPVRSGGMVHGRGASFADARGPFLALGATLFWGPWGYKFDRDRLERTLKFLAEHHVDYVRVLGQVGTPDDPDDSWSDRPIDPRWDDPCPTSDTPPPTCGTYDEVIAGFTDLAYDRYGLRVEWTIFGGVGFTPTPRSRVALVDRMLAMAKGREQKIMHFEIANEFYQNGFEGPEGLEELRRLGKRLQDRTRVLVALSEPPASDCGVLQRMHAGGVGEIVTEHFTRSDDDDGWAAVRAPWKLQACRGLPRLRSNNEPAGPFSSVRAEGDPLRLAMSAAVTYASGMGAYVLHTGSGVRGGGRADLKLGRPADIQAVPEIDRILGALDRVRRLLPPDLPQWPRRLAGNQDPIRLRSGNSGAVTAFTTTRNHRFVVLPLAIEGPLTVQARVRVDLLVVDPVTGEVRFKGTLPASGTATVDGSSAYILTGETR